MSIIELYKFICTGRRKSPEAKMTLDQIYDFIEKYYGYKVFLIGQNNEKQEIYFILYDSFSITCGLDEHGSFGATINLPNNLATTYFLGFECSLVENNKKSIKNALEKIDKHCRFSLPDKFLKEYDRVYRINGHYLGPR